MSEEQEMIPDELTLLKEMADRMGIKYSPNIGLATLKERIEAKKAGQVDPTLAAEELETIQAAEKSAAGFGQMTTAQAVAAQRKKDALRLVRIRLTDMNPVNGNLKGVLMSAGNAKLGFVKKFIPFNAEHGWHVPNIIVQQLKTKKFMSHYEVKQGNKKIKKHKLVPQYAIEILPPLTAKELQELKQRQLMASGQG